MPAVMTTHYNAAGVPNGTMTRSVAALVQVVLLGIVSGVFLGLPLLLGRVPPAQLKVPHREYWLAPGRLKETLSAIQARLSVFGSGSLAFLLLVSELNFRANLDPPPRLPTTPLIAALAGYGLFVGGWMLSFLRRFHRPSAG
jgi:uncharacterized membrane protein